jgi:uncharacterized protein
MAGISYFEAAFRTIRDIIPPRVGINHTIQTNGTLIDDEWCSFFRTYDISLGLSLDGPEHIHDHARKTRSGRGTFTRVIDAITLLKSNNVDFHIICVLTRYGLERYQEICDFFAELELREVCYNIDESDGVNISSVLGSPDVAYPLTRQLFRSLLEVATLPDQKMWIRELNKMLGRLAAVSAGYQSIPNDLVEPLNILTVTYDGGWSTFSPELAGITSAAYSNFIFGNLTRESIYDGIARKAFDIVAGDIQAGVAQCKATCDYFRVCGGGAPSNKFAETGSMAIAETAFCRVWTKGIADACLDHLEGTMTVLGQ